MLQKSELFKLDSFKMYEPSSFIVQTLPIHDEDSSTDENENMHLLVKGFRRKATMGYDLMTGLELRETYRAMIKKVNYYNYTYPDVLLGSHTMQIYIPEYTFEVLNYAVTSTDDMGLYQDISFEFIGTTMTDY